MGRLPGGLTIDYRGNAQYAVTWQGLGGSNPCTGEGMSVDEAAFNLLKISYVKEAVTDGP